MKIHRFYRVAIFGLLALAAIIYPKHAHAKVGDNIEQTNKQFGHPVKEVDGGKVYISNDLLVIACFDNSNICQAVAYMKVNGQLSDTTIKQIDNLNIPPHTGTWTEIPISQPGFKYWSSPDLPVFVAAGNSYDDSTHLSFSIRAYMSMQGAFLMESVGKLMGGEYPNGQFTAPQASQTY